MLESEREDLSPFQRRLAEAFSPIGFGFPSWREIPEPLSPTALAILGAYDLAAKPTAAGAMGGGATLQLGYLELEALYRFHGITDADDQEWLAMVFEVIRAARAEGRSAGEAERREKEKRE